MKLYIDKIEEELLKPNNIRKTRNNLKKEMKSWEDKIVRVEDKSSRFVALNTNNYIGKMEQQLNRSPFDKLNSEPSSEFKQIG